MMRSYQFLTFIFLSLSLLLTSCQNSDNSANQPKTVPTDATANPFSNSTTAPAPPAADPGSFSATEPHYKCPNNCAGGGGPAKGSCPVCGTEMAHNAAYHNTPSTTTTTTTPSFNNPEANAPAPSFNANEPHYKCPNNCAGGHGPAKGNCPVCGTALAHNAAYHNTTNSTTPTITTPNANTPTLTPPAGATNGATASGQNAAGVYHYICNNGCAGGASAGIACTTCGSTLVHNAAYHN